MRLGNYYRSLFFTGKASMPKTLGSDAEVAAYVPKTKGAIGYIGVDAAAPGTKNDRAEVSRSLDQGRRQFSIHSASDEESLTNTRLPEMAG